MLCIAPMTVTKRSWTPGRARRKPLKPLRRECRIVFGEPVVTTLVCSFSFAREAAGASGIRHFLRPLLFEGRVDGTARARSRRGNAETRLHLLFENLLLSRPILRDASLALGSS